MTPRLHVNVVPSHFYVKSRYIESAQIVQPFSVTIAIDKIEFAELTPDMRSLVIKQFDVNGAMVPDVTIEIITNSRLNTNRAIVLAVVELLARDDQAMLDQLSRDWNALADEDSAS